MKKKIIITLGVVFLILLGAEIFLRSYYGFCSAVLMREDSDYEYIAEKNRRDSGLEIIFFIILNQ